MKIQEILYEDRNPDMSYYTWLQLFHFKWRLYQAKPTERAKRDLQKHADDYPEYYKKYEKDTTKKPDSELGPDGYRWVNPNAKDF